MKQPNQKSLPPTAAMAVIEPAVASTSIKGAPPSGLQRNRGLGVIAALGVAGFLLLSGNEPGGDPLPLAEHTNAPGLIDPAQPTAAAEPELTPHVAKEMEPITEPVAKAETENDATTPIETAPVPAANPVAEPATPRDGSAGVKVDLAEAVRFSPGSAELDSTAVAALTEAAAELKQSPHQAVVAGYADDTEISPRLAAKYPTNWELASARAASVVRLLEQQGVPPSQLLAVSYGDNHPIASNATVRGRALNRRIEIFQQQEPMAIN